MFKKTSFSVVVIWMTATLGVLPSTYALSQDRSDRSYRIEDIERLRWIDPLGRKPMTYEEYMKKLGDIPPFEIEEVYGSSRKGTDSSLVCIVVNESLYPSITDSLSQYVADVELSGYSVSIYTTSGGEPYDLRTFLQGLLADSLVGSVFIGDLPVAWYEMDEWGHEEFPIDLYYMDLDGIWADQDFDDIFDGHTGNVEPDIWVGRLTASPLSFGGVDEVSLLRSYFHRNHQYRVGNLSLTKRALVYVDDDWAGSAEEWSENVGLAYWERTMVADSEMTRAGDYSERLGQGYEWVQVCAHSSPALHTFAYNSYTDWDYFHNDTIPEVDPPAFFFNLFACSNARFVESDYMGGWYVFNPPYGLAALGSTKTGSMLYFEDFYGPLREYKPLGEAFKEWLAEVGEESRPWFYGMTLLGDPLLDLRNEISFLEYAVDDDTSGESSGNESGTVDPGETIELPVTLSNRGQETLLGVTATLTTDDAFVTILDGYEEYGNIGPGSSATSSEDYDLYVSPSCPRGHQLFFALDISAGNGRNWIDGFSIAIEEPLISYFAHLIVDTTTGNGNGEADPGETVQMQIVLANAGPVQGSSEYLLGSSQKAAAVSADLSTTDPQISIDVGTAQFGNIMPGDTARCFSAYKFTVDAGCPDYHLTQFLLNISADGWYSTTDSFSLAVGGNFLFRDDMESGINGWSHYEVTSEYVDEWHQTNYRNHSVNGGTSWKCGGAGSGSYSNMTDAGLVTPEIELGSDGIFVFWHWIDAETASDATAWDGGIVEIDSGGGWQQIEPRGGYPYRTVGGAGGPFPDSTPCFSGTQSWSDVEFDLSGYSGLVQFRFRFGSDVGVTKEGWYVDDVMVWGVPAFPILECSLWAEPDTAVMDQSIYLYMKVENEGGGVDSVVPQIALLGDGSVSVVSGPIPPYADLSAGVDTIFSWVYTAQDTHWVYWAGFASGKDHNSGFPGSSPEDTSNQVCIQTAPALVFVANSVDPDTVGQGELTGYSLMVRNDGEAWIRLMPQTTFWYADTSGDTVRTHLVDTTFVGSLTDSVTLSFGAVTVPPGMESGDWVSWISLDGIARNGYSESHLEIADTVTVLLLYACGDCNGDGFVTFADALYVKNYYYQTPPRSPAPIGQGDVNLDGFVNFADALYIKNYYYQTPPGSPPPCEPTVAAPLRERRIER